MKARSIDSFQGEKSNCRELAVNILIFTCDRRAMEVEFLLYGKMLFS